MEDVLVNHKNFGTATANFFQQILCYYVPAAEHYHGTQVRVLPDKKQVSPKFSGLESRRNNIFFKWSRAESIIYPQEG